MTLAAASATVSARTGSQHAAPLPVAATYPEPMTTAEAAADTSRGPTLRGRLMRGLRTFAVLSAASLLLLGDGTASVIVGAISLAAAAAWLWPEPDQPATTASTARRRWRPMAGGIAVWGTLAALLIFGGDSADELRWLPLFAVTYGAARRFARWALPQRAPSR